MTDGKNHAIENVKGYLGKSASVFTALIWIIAFLIWYVLQIQGATEVIGKAIPGVQGWQIAAFLGVLTAGCSFWGISLIKRVCIKAAPLLFLLAVYLVVNAPRTVVFTGTWGISFFAILSVILIWLPGIVNLPTIFRHSKSKDDSVLGLCAMTGIHAFFQIFTILIDIGSPVEILANYAGGIFGLISVVSFTFLSLLCVNLVNIYLASAGWESIHIKFKHPKGYLVFGLCGTAAYFFHRLTTQFFFHMGTIETVLTSFIASLGVVLIIDFMIRIIVRHRPRPFEKMCSNFCWFSGCAASLFAQVRSPAQLEISPQYTNEFLLIGILASSLMFLFILFVEETVWAVKNLPQKA